MVRQLISIGLFVAFLTGCVISIDINKNDGATSPAYKNDK